MTDLVLPSGASVTSPPVVRVAGLPSTALNRLRFERSAARIEELIRMRAWLTQEADSLSERLYEVIGGLPDGGVKPALIGLRRAVHQGRRPRAAESSEAVLSSIPVAAAERLQAWLGRLADLERHAAELPEILAAETAEKEATLREVAGSPGFRRALSQASPSLFAELSKWLEDEKSRPRRQTMTRLAKYISRASAKTSPYSTFTISGAGSWVAEGPAVRFTGGSPVSGVLELQGFLLRTVIGALCESPGAASSLRLRLNPSATAENGRIGFVGRPPNESIMSIPAIPAITECLRIMTDEPDLSRTELRARLMPDGAGARAEAHADAEADADAVDDFIDGLVDRGLLIPHLPVTDRAMDPLGDLSRWVAAGGDHELQDIVPLLDRVQAEVYRHVPVDDVEAHVARQYELRAAAGDLAKRLDLPPERVEAIGKGLFHENAVFTGSPAECALPCWRPALDDLDAVRRWLAPFDPTLPLKLALGAYHAERFGIGARTPVLSLYRAVHEELARRNGGDRTDAAKEMTRFLLEPPLPVGPALAGSPLPRLRELARAQEEARHAVLVPAGPDGVIRVTAPDLASVTSVWPSWMNPPESLGCYVQPIDRPAGRGAALSVVLNVAHTGFGRGRTRLAHLIRRAGGTPPDDRVPPASGTGPETGRMLAELGGGFASALNTRVDGVPHELDYPFTHSARPAAERVPLGDLVVVHDPASGLSRLVSARTGTEVTPLHLGMMADILLPPLARLIVWAFGSAFYLHTSMSPLARATDFAVPESVVEHPRVAVGRVVLRRRRWVVPTAQVPARTKAETDSAYLLRTVEWLRAHGIPTRCYIRILSERLWSQEGPDSQWGRWVLDKSRKPVFIDFANWFLVQAFARMLSGAGPAVSFEEALPDPGDAHLGQDHEPAVSEFLIEISDKRVPL